MTQDEIIRMARDAGLLAEDEAWVSPHQEAMERFAALAFAAGAAHEREACAKLCNEPFYMQQRAKTSAECAAAIRARS